MTLLLFIKSKVRAIINYEPYITAFNYALVKFPLLIKGIKNGCFLTKKIVKLLIL